MVKTRSMINKLVDESPQPDPNRRSYARRARPAVQTTRLNSTLNTHGSRTDSSQQTGKLRKRAAACREEREVREDTGTPSASDSDCVLPQIMAHEPDAASSSGPYVLAVEPEPFPCMYVEVPPEKLPVTRKQEPVLDLATAYGLEPSGRIPAYATAPVLAGGPNMFGPANEAEMPSDDLYHDFKQLQEVYEHVPGGLEPEPENSGLLLGQPLEKF